LREFLSPEAPSKMDIACSVKGQGRENGSLQTCSYQISCQYVDNNLASLSEWKALPKQFQCILKPCYTTDLFLTKKAVQFRNGIVCVVSNFVWKLFILNFFMLKLFKIGYFQI
jgi:hypothetical protein